MVIAAALVSLGVSFLAGWILFRRARRSVGPSWDEWRDAGRLGGRWARLIAVAVGAATLVGIRGFGVPGALRVALLGAIVGFCIPFAAEGVRRYLRARRIP